MNKNHIIRNNKGSLYDDETNVNLDENTVLRNILQIKRAGDYSQIWFCKKWNASNVKKLFFMSNDRVSASFCLLEEVPYIGQVSNYNFYFNPSGPDITAIQEIQTILKSIGFNIGLYDLLKQNNEEILNNHNELCYIDNGEEFENRCYDDIIEHIKFSQIQCNCFKKLVVLFKNS